MKIQHTISLSKEPNAEWFVAIPGSGDGVNYYKEIFPLLNKNGYHVLVPDNPGVNGAPEYPYVSPEERAIELQNLIDELGIVKYNLLGHSHGVFVAQHMARNKPEAIENLILIGGGMGSFNHIETINFQLDLTEQFVNAFAKEEPEKSELRNKAFGLLFGHKAQSQKFEEFFAKFVEDRLALTSEARFSYIWGGSQFSGIQITPQIKARTLIIGGVDDPIVPIKNSRQLHSVLENSEILELEGVGHYPQIEDSTIWPKIIQFMNGEQIGKVLPNRKNFVDMEDFIIRDKQFLKAVADINALGEVLANAFRNRELPLSERKSLYKDFITK